MKKQMRYLPEVRERAVRLLREHQGDYASEWIAIVSKIVGCAAETCANGYDRLRLIKVFEAACQPRSVSDSRN
jgi:transposase-like protein